MGVNACDQLPTCVRQMNYPGPPIGSMRAALDQSLRLQAINRDCDRAARQQNFFSDLVNGQRPFVKQGFEHGEVTAAHLQLHDTLFGIGLSRTRRLPQHEENVNTSSAGQRFQFIYTHPSTLMSRYFCTKVDVKGSGDFGSALICQGRISEVMTLNRRTGSGSDLADTLNFTATTAG